MNQSDADKIIVRLLPISQKAISIIREGIGEELEDVIMQDLFPWLCGDKSILHTLIRLNERIDTGGHVEPIEFFNTLTVLHKWCAPVIVLYAISYGDLPEPDYRWLAGFTK